MIGVDGVDDFDHHLGAVSFPFLILILPLVNIESDLAFRLQAKTDATKEFRLLVHLDHVWEFHCHTQLIAYVDVDLEDGRRVRRSMMDARKGLPLFYRHRTLARGSVGQGWDIAANGLHRLPIPIVRRDWKQ